MEAFVPVGTSTPTIVQVKQSGTYNATFDAAPAAGNKIFCLVNGQQGIANIPLDLGGLTTIGPFLYAGSDATSGVARLGYRDVLPGDPAGPYGNGTIGSNIQTTIFEVSGLPAGGPLNTVSAVDQSGTGVSRSITPTGGVPAFLVGGFGSFLYAAFGGAPTFTPNGSTTAVGNLITNDTMWGVAQPFYGLSAGGAVTLGGTQGGDTNGSYRYAIAVAAFDRGSGGLSFDAAPETVDEDDGSSVLVLETAIGLADDVFWRADLGESVTVADIRAVLGFEDAGDVTVLVQGGDAGDWSDAATVIELTFDATGSLTPDDLGVIFDGTDAHRYWQFVLVGSQSVEVFEVSIQAASEVVPTIPAKAILEIYVHDEDASRWGTATWATGPATGTEGIWSGAGWQDVTPQGVNAHIIWGSRRPSRGILAEQSPASWNVETYDPERILDPGNFDSPYYPQLVAGVPIRISHESLVIRTGIVDEWHYKLKAPNYQGQILASDSWSLINQAMVPPDSILGNTLYGRIRDAIDAAGIAVGGIPVKPRDGPIGPTIADWVEGAPTDDATSVGEHVRIAASEVLWVPLIMADGSLGLRSWGVPLDRGRTIEAPNLEDLEAVSHEDGLYSVVKVQVEDPDADPIIRKAAPLPRYGERVWERREPTIDPEGYAAAILGERPWPGVQWVPGAIHCFTAADVEYFGSLQLMERVTLTVPGAVSVQGRILGGELFVEHRARDTKGAKWLFYFAVATDGSTAIGSTILVADGTGETLLDDMTETDFLEAD